MNSFLFGRKQFVSLGNAIRKLLNIEFGIPQGSTLGAVLFILFINVIMKLKLHINNNRSINIFLNGYMVQKFRVNRQANRI